MAVARDVNNSDYILAHLAAVAFFCGMSCTILMLRFGGFKVSLNLSGGKRRKEHYDLAPQVSVSGAYRTSRDEYFGNNNYSDPRKNISPSMVKLPQQANQAHVSGHIKPSKSTGDLSRVNNTSVELRKSTPNITVTNAAQTSKEDKQRLKEQKRIEKERLAEQKKREKLAAQEREKQEKLRKEREKRIAKQEVKDTRENHKLKKKVAPPPPQKTVPIQIKAPQPSANPLSQRPAQYSTNTLDSSISRSSGPPPYADSLEALPNKSYDAGNNIRLGKPAEATSSWDLITQHRQQINRTPGITGNNSKQKHLDLNYNASKSEDIDNSEA